MLIKVDFRRPSAFRLQVIPKLGIHNLSIMHPLFYRTREE